MDILCLSQHALDHLWKDYISGVIESADGTLPITQPLKFYFQASSSSHSRKRYIELTVRKYWFHQINPANLKLKAEKTKKKKQFEWNLREKDDIKRDRQAIVSALIVSFFPVWRKQCLVGH